MGKDRNIKEEYFPDHHLVKRREEGKRLKLSKTCHFQAPRING